ncbi:MAG: DUF2059 domain-containing protein [Deltaproteobacteria bacterium]|nr:DUF2059 domain-containing protein [Deltaproteobacteria bacterium]
MKNISTAILTKTLAALFFSFTILLAGQASGGEKERLIFAYLVVEKSGEAQTFLKVFEIMIESYFETYKSDNREARIAMTTFKNILMEEIRSSEKDLKWELAKIYAKHFTESELKVIVYFFDSPVGKSWIAKQPILEAEGEELGKDLAQTIMYRVILRIKALTE